MSILRFVDFFPFNDANYTFELLYLALIVATLFGIMLIRRFYGSKLDDRNTAPEDQRRLSIGTDPQNEDCYLIAYLLGWPDGVAYTLIGTATAAGHLKPDGEGLRVPPAEPVEGTPILRHFLQEIRRRAPAGSAPDEFFLSATEVRAAARETVNAHATGFKKQLTKDGLLRLPQVNQRLNRIDLPLASLVLCIGAARLVRGLLLDQDVSFLAFAMAFAAMALLLVPAGTPLTELMPPYLAWLKANTFSLRNRPESDPVESPQEAGLTLALYGTDALGGSLGRLLAPVWAQIVPPGMTQEVLLSGGGDRDGGSWGDSGFGGG